ncbi:hypothetical protein [Glaciibacter sp. 2TAF33]|uniref:hypothetical protein n=1 Tax=Glaciibacter sp. 2TAF33 TaxID=3233015 RepID=UPI003F8F22D3
MGKRRFTRPVRRIPFERDERVGNDHAPAFPALMVRPKSDLWVSAWVAFSLLTLPLFGAFYLITVPTGRWLPFASAHAVLILLFVLTAWRLKGAGILLAPDGMREREYLRRKVFTPVEVIASVVVVKLRDSNSDSVSQQMFMVDASGNTLLRMRGPMWHASDLWRVIDYYAIPVRLVDTPMTWSELRRSQYRRNISVWERHPIVLLVCLVGVFAAVMIPALLVVVPVVNGPP